MIVTGLCRERQRVWARVVRFLIPLSNDALTTPLEAFLPVRTTSLEECTRASRGHAFEIKHRMNVLLFGPSAAARKAEDKIKDTVSNLSVVEG